MIDTKYKAKLSSFWHLFGGLMIYVLIKVYIEEGFSDDLEGLFWLCSFILIPYLLTLYRIVLKQDFIIEIKECEDEIQINYYNGVEKFKSIVCKYDDIKDWGVKDTDTGISRFKRAYIKDKYTTYEIVLGYFPIDLRGFEAYITFDIKDDLDNILKGKIMKSY